jgi:hypothetical protein
VHAAARRTATIDGNTARSTGDEGTAIPRVARDNGNSLPDSEERKPRARARWFEGKQRCEMKCEDQLDIERRCQ